MALGGCSPLAAEAPGTVLAVPDSPWDGCANRRGAEIPSSTVHGWAQGHLVRLWGRGAVRGDGGDGDGGSGGVFALSVCPCCRALMLGPPGDPTAVWCPGKGCRGCASTSASALATSQRPWAVHAALLGSGWGEDMSDPWHVRGAGAGGLLAGGSWG